MSDYEIEILWRRVEKLKLRNKEFRKITGSLIVCLEHIRKHYPDVMDRIDRDTIDREIKLAKEQIKEAKL